MAEEARRPLILVVEDDATQRAFLEEVLDLSGYGCEAASTLSEGQSLFEKGKFACALIDLGLPDGDGLDLLEEFSMADPTLVPIVLTGEIKAETVINTMREGAFDYLTKPVHLTTLRAALARALSHHAVVRERAELFRLLLEEREQLRARVEAATADIRQYASACERSNARLRALLNLTQTASNYYSEEDLLRGTFTDLKTHVPVRCIVVCDVTRRRLISVYENQEGEIRFLGGNGSLDIEDTASVLLESEPELMLRAWLERNAGLDTSGLVSVVFPQTRRNMVDHMAGFYLTSDFTDDAADREFLDMCARFITFEWERAKLLLHVAHHASLGNIGIELARNFIQPLTAIRTASDFVNEAVISPEAAEGMTVIRDSVERLHRQTQEFRKLSLLREGSVETVRLDEFVDQALDILAVAVQNRQVTFERQFLTDSECVLLNGTTLARTFLDLILGALRVVEIGGTIRLTLREADADHVSFELVHACPNAGTMGIGTLALTGCTLEEENPGLQLAERTIHSCGGTLSVELEGEGNRKLRVLLPRNATSLSARRETAK